MKKIKFEVTGMTCSSCSAHVDRAVRKLDGVKDVNVNLLSNSMVVEYDESIQDNDSIILAVKEAGYDAKNAKIEQKNNKNGNVQNTVNDIQVENIKNMKKRLIFSFIFLIPLMYIAMHHMFPVPQFIQQIFSGKENVLIFCFSQLVLLIPILILNRNYFIIGFKRLFKGAPNMDSLIALGSGAATLYGLFAISQIVLGLNQNDLSLVERYSKDIYFESAGTILTLITFGKYLEAKSKGKTSDAISKLINLAPKTAIVEKQEKEIEIPIEEIKVDDIVIIKPGTSIPVDGVIIEGESSLDQSSITGESIPVEKSIGEEVISGTINKNGYLKIKALKVGSDTTLSQIIKLIEEASNSKAPISKIADKVSGIFVPVVILIAAISIIVWLLLGQTFEFALTMGIAVLVISCPCALGLATPVAIMIGTGKGAENGILFKTAESLEILHLVDTVVLDKTGTITEGKPKVTDIISIIEENELLKIAGSLERNSEHPLAEAVLEKIREERIELLEVKEFNSISGRGVKGKIKDVSYFGGNLAFMSENNINTDKIIKKSNDLSKEAKTLLYFARETEVIGIIAVSDTIKNTSAKAIQELKNNNINVVMITGDNKLAAEAIAKEVGIYNVIAEVLPQDKEKEVAKLQSQGKKVTFVGDGINDSLALVRADVGISIGSGTDIAIESADVILMKDSLLDVVTAIDLSRSVIKNIKMNLFWAFFYNTIGIPIAAGVFYNFGLKLNPMLGAAAMSLSSVCVVTNALRLRKFKPYLKEEEKMNTVTKIIYIEGMSCNHCKMSVEKALKAIDAVIKVNVELDKKCAIVELNREIDNNIFEDIIKELGFELKNIK